ncbi:MAG: LamG domain-containing protein [bacterium]|nr:LamG domain-containing protein [bacterium]
MNILNRKNRNIFPLVGFTIAFILIGSYITFTQPTSAQNCVEPPSGLVSWWNGSRKQPTNTSRYTALDISGGNNGTIISQSASPYQHPGKVGEAFWFGETTTADFRGIDMQNPTNLNFGTGPFSLEAWFTWNGIGNVNNIIRKTGLPGSNSLAGYWLRISGNRLEFYARDNSTQNGSVVTTSVSPKTWYHVIATRDSSGTMRLYVDGILKNTAKVSSANITGPAPFIVGAWKSSTEFGVSAGEIFAGFIDEVSVYSKALSQSEVESIFNAGSSGKCPPSITPVTPTPAVLSNIKYPVTKLGNCTDQQDCKNYCDISSNYSQCAAFAQNNNLVVLVPDDKKAVFAAMQKGESPGQCKDEASCRNYCEDIDNIGECVDFVEKFNLASSDELKEIRQMADVKKAGVAFPGNCKTKESCLKYCDNSANAVVCMEFALKAGFIPKEDAEAVSKIIPYLKSGGKLPGGCTTKESCDAYCGSETHVIECVDFAVGAGFMSKEDAEIVKKTGGKGPGNCRSKEACENYCKDEKHIDECVDFGVKAGFISAEEAEMAKKFKITSGPGGCKSKADCEAFCVVNQDICIEWGKEHGIDMGGGQAGPGTAEECAKYGGNWDGKKCELGSSECVKQGGSWGPDKETGKETCNFSGGMGPDIRKEIESCLSKTTCAEFNLCFDALPKGNQQQSSGQGQQQGPQDENGKKVEARARACIEEKMDSCLVLSCSEFEACLKSLQQGSPEQGTGDQKPGQSQENPKFNAKIKACQEEIKAIKTKEIQEKMAACLTRSCSEFESCIKSVQPSGDQGGQQNGQQQGQGTPDPAVDAKIQTCQKEKVNVCLSKPCNEFQACLNALGGGGSGGEQQQSAPDPAVQSKFMTCFPPPPSGGGQ